MRSPMLILAAVTTFGLPSASSAQDRPAPPAVTQGAQNIKRTPLQKFDVPGINFETVVGIAEIIADVNIGRHTHFGPEAGYVLEGGIVLLVDGQPERALKAGESYTVPAGVIHDAKSGPQGAKVIATYVVEKGKPLVTPAN